MRVQVVRFGRSTAALGATASPVGGPRLVCRTATQRQASATSLSAFAEILSLFSVRLPVKVVSLFYLGFGSVRYSVKLQGVAPFVVRAGGGLLTFCRANSERAFLEEHT